jgi:hypothetical protein
VGPAVNTEQVFAQTSSELPPMPMMPAEPVQPRSERHDGGENPDEQRGGFGGRRRGRYGFGRNRNNRPNPNQPQGQQQPYPPPMPRAEDEAMPGNVAEIIPGDENDSVGNIEGASGYVPPEGNGAGDQQRRGGRRRGRRGGRGRRNGGEGGAAGGNMDRPPRDPNYRPRYEQRPDNRRPYEPRGGEPTAAAPIIPASIHDIDTTPRVESAPRSYDTPPAPQPRSAPAVSSPYEVVQSTDKPKGGWWKKLTGGGE